jgi:DDE family transposase
VARDRLISTVDVEARHGHKSRAPSFDGYKSHFGVDPDDELITNVAVTAANTAHREVIDELLDQPTGAPAADTGEDSGSDSQGGPESKGFEVYGDSAYADGATLDEQAARVMTCAPRCPRCATRTAIPKISSALIWPPARSPARLATP